MEYQIEVDYVSNACGITYWPQETFNHKGNPIEACNFRINEILETGEHGLNSGNIVRARLFLVGGENNLEVLAVNYREGKWTQKQKIQDFWIKN